jgi:hypothetical protein
MNEIDDDAKTNLWEPEVATTRREKGVSGGKLGGGGEFGVQKGQSKK